MYPYNIYIRIQWYFKRKIVFLFLSVYFLVGGPLYTLNTECTSIIVLCNTQCYFSTSRIFCPTFSCLKSFLTSVGLKSSLELVCIIQLDSVCLSSSSFTLSPSSLHLCLSEQTLDHSLPNPLRNRKGEDVSKCIFSSLN